MKKIFTMMLFAAGTIGFASAQARNDRDIAYNEKNKAGNERERGPAFEKNKSADYNDNYFSYKEKELRLRKINQSYAEKVAFVKHDRRLNGREKAKQIQWLQAQRQNEISRLDYQYAKNNQKQGGRNTGHDSKKW